MYSCTSSKPTSRQHFMFLTFRCSLFFMNNYKHTLFSLEWPFDETSRNRFSALSIMFPTDRKVDINGRVLFCFWFCKGLEKEIEFWKCSSKLMNVVLTEESNFMAVLCLYLE